MLPPHVALASKSESVSASDLADVASAIQKQVVRDFDPIWKTQATISAYHESGQVPLDYWIVTVCDDTGDLNEGVHRDVHGQPFALVQYDDLWTLGVSHECLEMLADPFCCRMIAGQSPKTDQGRVRFLVEVCDPCQDPTFGYTVNGVKVSDFVTPNYFDPVASSGVRYSYSGRVTGPHEVLKNGYLSWLEPRTGHWWQKRLFRNKAEFSDLGLLRQTGEGIRPAVDAVTPRQRRARTRAGRLAKR